MTCRLFLQRLSARVGRRNIPTGLPHHPFDEVPAPLTSGSAPAPPGGRSRRGTHPTPVRFRSRAASWPHRRSAWSRLIACLSNDAIRVARESTKASRSESGNDRLTYPYRSARSPGMSSAPEKHFERASSSHQPWQPRHWAASRDHTSPDFEVRQDRFFAAGEAHVAGQRKLTSDTGGASADRRDRHNRRPAQAHEHVGQRLQARLAPGEAESFPRVWRRNRSASERTLPRRCRRRRL